ncbi:MAG: hypothetical protein CMB80_01175 [Flammeovirgaceae bacterium]|nr:hypothetical protein [Flammeovirgaceae bacterium]
MSKQKESSSLSKIANEKLYPTGGGFPCYKAIMCASGLRVSVQIDSFCMAYQETRLKSYGSFEVASCPTNHEHITKHLNSYPSAKIWTQEQATKELQKFLLNDVPDELNDKGFFSSVGINQILILILANGGILEGTLPSFHIHPDNDPMIEIDSDGLPVIVSHSLVTMRAKEISDE